MNVMILQVAGYSGLLLSVPTVLYEVVAYVVPGLTRSERQLLAPIIFGSSILFYIGYVSSLLHVSNSRFDSLVTQHIPCISSIVNSYCLLRSGLTKLSWNAIILQVP